MDTVCGYTCCASGVSQHQGVQFVQACLGSHHQHGIRMVPAFRMALLMCGALSLMSRLIYFLGPRSQPACIILVPDILYAIVLCMFLLLHGLVRGAPQSYRRGGRWA